VVFGAFTQFGAGASLDVQCAAVKADPELRPRRIFVQSGTLGEIIPKLDDLAAKIARFMTSGSPGGLPVAASEPSELDDIRRRLDALERAVRSESAKPAQPAQPVAPAPAPAQAPSPGAPGAPPAAGATR
jgi:hypothetical protein